MILKFPFSKRGRIYTATILMLFFLGNIYTKHKFHEKAVEELQMALKADKVTSNEIFGRRQQYVAISHEEPTYYNSEDNVATEMIGRNHFVRYYDTMSSLHQAHLVVYDINKNFEKKIINLTPYLKKIKDFKDIKELAVSLRSIDGYDYVFLENSQNVNQNLIIPTIMASFWCQLVLIIVISRLRDLKHRHLAGAFFLALIQDNIAELSKLNCVPNVLKYNPD